MSGSKLRDGSSSGSQAQDETIRLPAPSRNNTTAPSSTCRYATEDTTTGCFTYRNCQECLAKEGCYVGTDGYCLAQGGPPQYDYHRAFNTSFVLPAARTTNATGLLGLQTWQFPATDFDYCSSNGTICAECIQQHFWLSPGASEDSRFCAGAINCICIANCARIVNATYCPPPKVPHDKDMENSGDRVTTIVTLLFVGIFLMVILLVTICCCAARSFERGRQPNARASHAVPAAYRARTLTVASSTYSADPETAAVPSLK